MELTKLGAVTLDPNTNAPVVQAFVEVSTTPDDVEPFGQSDFYGALGVVALPAPADPDGAAADGIVAAVGSGDGSVIAARDVRTMDIMGELKPGETALYSTAKGFSSRVLCKDQAVVVAIGDPVDVTINVNRADKTIQIVGFGHIFEMSAAQGIQLSEKGGASFSMQAGAVVIDGTSITLGRSASPATPAAIGTGAPLNLISSKVYIALA